MSGCIPLWGSREFATYSAGSPEIREPRPMVLDEILETARYLAEKRNSGADCVCEALSTLIALESRHCSFEDVHSQLDSKSYQKTILLRDPTINLNSGERTYKVASVFAKLPVADSKANVGVYGHLQHARIIRMSSLALRVTTNGSFITPGVPQPNLVALLHNDEPVAGKTWENGLKVVSSDSVHRNYLIVDEALSWAFKNCTGTVPSQAEVLERIESESGDIYPQFRAIVHSLYKSTPNVEEFRKRVVRYRIRLWDAPSFFNLVRPAITSWIDNEASTLGDIDLLRAGKDPSELDEYEFRCVKPRRTIIEVASASVGGRLKVVIPAFSENEVELDSKQFDAVAKSLSVGTTLFGYVNFGAEKPEDLVCRNLEVAPSPNDFPR